MNKIGTTLVLLAGILAAPVGAQQRTYGNWITDFAISGFQFARTSNSSGSAAGVACNLTTQLCDAYVAPGTTCVEDGKYPIMLNSKIGAYALTGKCLYIGQSPVYIIEEFTSMIEAFESGSEIGFALPMESGQFKVFRFSTVGAAAAIKAARQPPTPKPPQERTKGGRDQML